MGNDMKIDSETPVTKAQLIGWGIMAISGVLTLSGVYYALNERLKVAEIDTASVRAYVERIDKRGADRMTVTDKNFADIRALLMSLPTMQLQINQITSEMAKTQQQIIDTNERTSRIVESWNNKFDNANEKQNEQSVKLGVIDEKIDNILRALSANDKPRPAILQSIR